MHQCGHEQATSESAPVVGVVQSVAIAIDPCRRILDKGPHMATRLHKRGADHLDYAIDLRRWLEDGETVVGAVATLRPATTPELGITRVEFTAVAVFVWLDGGKNGKSYRVSVMIRTSKGRERMFRFFMSVQGSATQHMLEPQSGSGAVCAGLAPLLHLSSTHLDFPDTLVGEVSPPIAVLVSNIGALSATIAAITVADGFTVTSDTGGTLEPGESVPLWVRFAPDDPGITGGYVVIDGNATAELTLLGEGL